MQSCCVFACKLCAILLHRRVFRCFWPTGDVRGGDGRDTSYCMVQFLSSVGCCEEGCDCCEALAAFTAAVRLPGDRCPAACCLAYAMASLGTYEIRAAAPAPGPYDRRAGSWYTDRSSSSLPELDEHVEQQPCSAAESSSKSSPVATFSDGGIGGGGGSLFRPPLRLRLRVLFRPSRRRRLVRFEVDGSADDEAAVPSNRTDRRPLDVISGVDDDDDARCCCSCSGLVPGGAAGGRLSAVAAGRRHDEDDGVGGYVSAVAVTASCGGGGGGGGGAAAVSFSNSVSNRSVMSSSETSFSRKL